MNTPTRPYPIGMSLTASGPALTNSTVQTSLLSKSYNGRNIIPANTMLPYNPGVKSVIIKGGGIISYTASPSLILNLNIAGTSLTNMNFPLSASTVTNGGWHFEIEFTIVNLTTIQFEGCVWVNTLNSTLGVNMGCSTGSAVLTTLNFAADQTIDLVALWNAASTSNSVTLTSFTLSPGQVI
jgi:hypothetical protein